MRRFLPPLISLIFLSLLLYLVPLEELLSDLKEVEPKRLLLSFSLYTLSQVTRSLRWRKVLRDLSLWDIFLINSANIFLNNLLPARTGELSWFYYAKRLGVDLKTSAWAFLIGRGYDLLGLLSLVLFSYLYVKDPVVALALLPAIGIVSLLLPLVRSFLPEWGRLKDLKDFLRREFTPLLSVWLFSLSFASFLLKALSVYVLFSGFGLFEFTLAFAGGELTSVLPLHSFMGYGTYETGFLIPLKVLGVDLKEALSVGFLAHNFLLISSAIWGFLSIGLLHTLSRKSP